MKQHITTEQINGLSKKGQGRLRRWWKPRDGDWYAHSSHRAWFTMLAHGAAKLEKNDNLPLLSIGQIIEFLDDTTGENFRTVGSKDVSQRSIGSPWHHWFTIHWNEDMELCDALWEAVKEVLEEGNVKLKK